MGQAGGGLLDSADSGLPLSTILETLGPVLSDASIVKIGHDLKLATVLLGRHGVELGGLEFDSMIGSYLIDPTRSAHTLEDTALEHLGYKAILEDDLTGKGPKAVPLSRQAPAALKDFASERADLPVQLAPRFERLASEGLTEVWERFERPLIPVLVAIERAGVSIDGPALAAQSERFVRELDALSRRIFELAGTEFNIASPKQLGEVLFEKMQLPVLKRTGALARSRRRSTCSRNWR